MADSKVILERRFIPKGAVIVKQGEDATSAFLIQSGAVVVYTENEAKDARIELARLGIGQIFGEMALIFDEKRSATVEATEDCNLIVITRQALQYKLFRSDPTVKALVEMLSRRVISANNAVMNKGNTLDDLGNGVRVIYQNIMSTLPRDQQEMFQDGVLSKMDEFLGAVDAFKDRFNK